MAGERALFAFWFGHRTDGAYRIASPEGRRLRERRSGRYRRHRGRLGHRDERQQKLDRECNPGADATQSAQSSGDRQASVSQRAAAARLHHRLGPTRFVAEINSIDGPQDPHCKSVAVPGRRDKTMNQKKWFINVRL
jgi:hypothetical protein